MRIWRPQCDSRHRALIVQLQPRPCTRGLPTTADGTATALLGEGHKKAGKCCRFQGSRSIAVSFLQGLSLSISHGPSELLCCGWTDRPQGLVRARLDVYQSPHGSAKDAVQPRRAGRVVDDGPAGGDDATGPAGR